MLLLSNSYSLFYHQEKGQGKVIYSGYEGGEVPQEEGASFCGQPWELLGILTAYTQEAWPRAIHSLREEALSVQIHGPTGERVCTFIVH